MSSTPVNPEAAPSPHPGPPEESGRWKTLLDALLPQRPIELAKQSDMVRLTRSWEPDEAGREGAIWTKTYQKARRGDGGTVDLSVFNAWERTLIVKAHEDGLESCYRLYQLYEKGTGLHAGDTPLELRKSRSTVIKTHHAGSDLDLWRLMRPWSKGGQLEHPFVQQQHFLKLVRGVLFALHGFHSKRFVHCDLHPGNIVLPAEVRALPAAHGEGERYELRALWDQVRLIDLGYSIHKGIEPPAMLPLALWELDAHSKKPKRDAAGQRCPSRRMSPHLHGRLKTLDAIASHWPDSERYNRTQWEPRQDQLNILQSLDWREDLYQLGYWLMQIRDGGEDSCWGGVHYMGEPVDVREVNAFIRDFPQELMDWGHAATLPAEMPHVAYISRIDALQKQLPALPDTFILHRRDHDSAYRTYLDLAHKQQPGQPADVQQKAAPGKALPLDVAAWNHVCILDTAAAYARYVRDWPQGQWVDEARAREQACLAEQAHGPVHASGHYGTRRAALVASVCLVAVAAAAWVGWRGSKAPVVVAKSAAPAAEVAHAKVVPTPAPAAVKLPMQVPIVAAARVAIAAPEAVSPPGAAAAAASAPVVDNDAELAAYRMRTAAVENSDWWLRGRSMKIGASDEQIAWVRETLVHAEKDRWPRAQFALASLYCSGASPALAPLSTRNCGEWTAAALANPLFNSAMTPADERNRMVSATVAEFDGMVFGYWQGKFYNSPPQFDFASALLVGLQALQDEYPGLALRAAHVQACALRPVQRTAARETLQALVRQHPGRPETAQAVRWLAEWRKGDYRRCRVNGR